MSNNPQCFYFLNTEIRNIQLLCPWLYMLGEIFINSLTVDIEKLHAYQTCTFLEVEKLKKDV